MFQAPGPFSLGDGPVGRLSPVCFQGRQYSAASHTSAAVRQDRRGAAQNRRGDRNHIIVEGANGKSVCARLFETAPCPGGAWTGIPGSSEWLLFACKLIADVAVVAGHSQRFFSAVFALRQIAFPFFELGLNGDIVITSHHCACDIPVFHGQV